MPLPAARLGAWLCLLGALCLGLLPGQALILCLGPEGTVALEGRPADGDCSGCPELSGGDSAAAGFGVRLGDSGDCPCTDVMVGQPTPESKTKPKRVELGSQVHWVVALAAAPRLGAGGARSLAPFEGPLVDPRLACIESVVLRL